MKKTEDFTLSSESIDTVSEKIEAWLSENKENGKNIIRMRLAMEEVMLRVKKEYGDGLSCSLRMGRKFGAKQIVLSYRERQFNPVEGAFDKDDQWVEDILSSTGLYPSWSYRNGTNEIAIRLGERSIGLEAVLALAIFLSVLFGMLESVFPEAVKSVLSLHVFPIITDVFMRFLNLFACLMIFLCLLNGICSIGNASDFSRMGKQMVVRYLISSFCISGIGILLFSLGLDLGVGGDNVSTSIADRLHKIFVEIFPNNPVEPFLSSNTLQLSVLAIIVGILLLQNSSTSTIRSFVSEANSIVTNGIMGVCKLLPLYIFVSLTKMFWESGFNEFLQLWKPIVIVVIACLIFVGSSLFFTSICFRISPLQIMKKVLSSVLVGLTTASSLMAFGTVMEVNEKKLGIKPELIKIGVPLGNVLFVGPFVFVFLIAPMYVAKIYGVDTPVIWYITLWILGTLFAISIPAVPGTFVSLLSLLFLQQRLPGEGLSLCIPLCMLCDFVVTASRIFMQHMELLHQAKKLDMLDTEILYSKS